MLNLNLNEVININQKQFEQICWQNPDLKLEKSASGNLIIMSPTGGETGRQNLDISGQLWLWNQQNKQGVAFDSSTMFILPSGANRSPDAAWIFLDKWQSLSSEEKKGFLPLCPDFVIELRSQSDTVKSLQDKMEEYMNNGSRLGWLIDSKNKQVEIYRQGKEKQVLQNPSNLEGEEVLLGFILNLKEIFN